LLTLLPTILLVSGKVNFTNLSRYSDLCEKTYRRQYRQSFAFIELNQQMIVEAVATPTQIVAAIDCSFIPKSGKATYGVDWFYNGSANRSEKGLEISVIAVIDVAAHRGYTLSVQQTPPTPVSIPPHTKGNGKGKGKGKQTVSRQDLEQIAEFLKQLPEKSNATQPPEQTAAPSITRVDHYLAHLQATHPYFPGGLKYLVGDGFYSKQKWVDGVLALELHLISKLRVDADLRYLYTGSQKPKGRHRQYDGKLELDDLSRFTLVDTLEANLKLYSAEVWHVSLKRKIRLALLVDTRTPDKTGYVLLFSTDVNLDAKTILDYYKARFQIEFIFRDAKQFTGLTDAQTRDPKTLDFHFNASLSALNLAKYDDQMRQLPTSKLSPFSMASYKRVAFNAHLLDRFISKLDLDPTLIKSHPNYQSLCSYGIIAV
jgi:DDE superfamily endonuclease